jgi:Kef-type K+ transport system membrane component KefB
MTPFLQLALALSILIAAAKLSGYISYQLGQPAVLGELFAGILIGPTAVNFLHLPWFPDEHLFETIHHLGEIGVLFLMFIAGLELHLTDLTKSGKVASLAGILGMIFPLGLGILLGVVLDMELPVAIFLGLILSATSVSISAQTLIELGVIRSWVGISLLGAAVLDDILVVLGLSVFTAAVLSTGSGGWVSILWIVIRMLLFLGLASLLGEIVLTRLSSKVNELPISQGLIAFVIVMILLYGWAAESLGQMAAITGTFLAGLFFARSQLKEKIEKGISVLAYSFFVPVFFIDVGLKANLRDLRGAAFWIFLTMTLVAVIGKVLGSGWGARIAGMSRREALQIGIGMMSRGEVGLIVAAVGITEGVLPQSIYSAVIGVVIVTTLLTPPLLRASFTTSAPEDGERAAEKSKPIAIEEHPEVRESQGGE